MNRRASLWVVMSCLAAAVLAGCGDPNIRKEKYLESGDRYRAEGKYKEAAVEYLNALKLDENYPEGHYELAQTYLHLGQFNAASGELARTVVLQPENIKARIDLGNLQLAAGRANDAQAQANAVTAARPNNPDAHALLSAIAVESGYKDQALTEIQRALELDPNRASFHNALALLQVDDPSKGSAVEGELKKSVALDSKSVNARLLLADIYARQSRWTEAEKVSWDAVTTDPKSILARESLAQVFLREGKQANAEEVLRQASKDLAENPQGARMLADYYAGSGQIDKAKAEFWRLTARYSRNIPLLKGLVRVLLEGGDYGTAQALLAQLMKRNFKDEEVAGLNGIVLLHSGKASAAVNALQGATLNFPRDAFLQYWLGKAALAGGDFPLAERSFSQAAALNPSKLDALEQLARIAILEGDMDRLWEIANKTIVAAPRFAEGYVWRATVEMNRNSPVKAEADLETAIGVAPRSAAAYLQFGKLRFAEKRFPEGIAFLEKSLEYDPNAVEVMQLLITYDLFRKQPDKAMARLRAQMLKCPSNGGFYDLLAQLQIYGKQLDQAATAAQKAIQLNSGDGEAVVLYTQVQVQRGQTANAVEAWQQWLKMHPNDAGALAILGTLEEARGNEQVAEVDYKESLQIQPNQPVAANNLAYQMLENGGNVDTALTYARTARRGMQNSPNTADTLAWAYYRKGLYGFARDLLEDAVKAEPSDAEIHYHLGMVYNKLKKKNDAAIHLKKAMSLAPDSPVGKGAEAALKGIG
jgi:tetratricopeptide (TPR) repeat protein